MTPPPESPTEKMKRLVAANETEEPAPPPPTSAPDTPALPAAPPAPADFNEAATVALPPVTSELPPTTSAPEPAPEADDALRWMEALARNQGAKPEELITQRPPAPPPPQREAPKPAPVEQSPEAAWRERQIAASQLLNKVELDEYGMPRPARRATVATPPPAPPPPKPPAAFQPAPTYEPTTLSRATRRRSNVQGCLVFSLFAIGGAFILAVIVFFISYWSIARTLPSVEDLQGQASQFETTHVYDAQGNLIDEIVDPQAGRRTRVPLSKISPFLIAATIATEDQNFYAHPGFDPLGIVRAILQNLNAGDTVSGASTITQQLVRALVFSPEERAQRTSMRKIREIILAAEITRTYSKEEILELYLNEINYGNLAYGIEAASQTYFRKSASELNLAEASFLAGLPQSPAVYDIFTNRKDTLARHKAVLTLMLDQQCILVSTQVNPVCVGKLDAAQALIAIEDYKFTPPVTTARFPHWASYIRQLLEAKYGQTIYGSGYSVYTTLDPTLQTLGEQSVAEQVATLVDRHVTNGALVALRPNTGEIVALVGSDDYNDPVDGQINMVLQPRQPGSSIKPLTYLQAFEQKGWSPATLLWDVPTEFPDGANPPYKPVNYDGRFHGPTLVRYALANSYNIPAVKALETVGIYGDSGFIAFAQKLGISTFTRNDYGLALTLGGGEVPLLEMTNAYGVLANGGKRIFPIALRKVVNLKGEVICEQPLAPSEVKTEPPPCQTVPDNWGGQIVSPENAYLMADILADNPARTPAFGPNSALNLSFPAAVKTGTTNDYRDNWTIGYTPDLVTGVWVGNADFTPMINTSGVTGAAPIWRAFMEGALAGKATPFNRPPGIIEKVICGISGAEPSEACPPERQYSERFNAANPPLPKERDLWQKIFLDPFTMLRQTAECAKYYQQDRQYEQEQVVVAVSDPWARKWLTEDPNGQAWAAQNGLGQPIVWAPEGECNADSPHPILSFASPVEGSQVNGVIAIMGQAAATKDFDHFVIEYGLSDNPEGWGQLQGPNTNQFPETAKLAEMNLEALPDGTVTVRIIVFSKAGGRAEARVHFKVQQPTPTATLTPSATPTDLPTATTIPATATPLPSATPIPSDTPLPPSPTPLGEIPTLPPPPP